MIIHVQQLNAQNIHLIIHLKWRIVKLDYFFFIIFHAFQNVLD